MLEFRKKLLESKPVSTLKQLRLQMIKPEGVRMKGSNNQGRIYWGAQGVRVPPIIFLIFVLQNVTKLVLHFTFVAISICIGNKSWSVYELPPNRISFLPCFPFGFELKNNYYVIINI